MDDKRVGELIGELKSLATGNLFGQDFLLTRDKSAEELKGVIRTAEILRGLRELNRSPRIFDSGLAVSLFRDNSTRTRFSFASACNLLGLAVQDLDEGKSQIAHGETVRETATMISFMADVVGIRDDMYIGKGHEYMVEVARALRKGYEEGVLEQRPALVNLQCDRDHPTQSMADLAHLVNHFGSVDALKGKKIAMSWAYSPSYGKPLSVPQGIIGLMTRFGMDVTLAHPPGYEVMPDIVKRAREQAKESGGSFSLCSTMEEAFEDAHVVYPKSWAPFAAMEERTHLYGEGDGKGIKELEQRLLAQNARYRQWECNESNMALTRDALYMHCLPADITGVSCKEGEVSPGVFDKHRTALYRQAGYKPYIIAAMIFLSKVKDPAGTLSRLAGKDRERSCL